MWVRPIVLPKGRVSAGLPLVKTFQYIHIRCKIAVLVWQFFLKQIESEARLEEFCSARRCRIRTHVVPRSEEGTESGQNTFQFLRERIE